MVDPRRKWKAYHQNIRIKDKRRSGVYVVQGSRGINYVVNLKEPSCECPDWQKRAPDGGCKHILHVKIQQGSINELPSAKTDFGNPDTRSSATYPSNWDELSWQTRKRDNWTCQKCGSKGGPAGDARLQAHHITPKSRGGKDKPGELITVCHSCHEQMHGHSIPPSTGSSSSDHDIGSDKPARSADPNTTEDISSRSTTNHTDTQRYPQPTSEELAENQPPHPCGPELKELEPPRPTDQNLRRRAPPTDQRSEALIDFKPYKPPEKKIGSFDPQTKNNHRNDPVEIDHSSQEDCGDAYVSKKNRLKNQKERQKTKQGASSQISSGDSIFQGHSSNKAKPHSKHSSQTATTATNIPRSIESVLIGTTGSIGLWLSIEVVVLFFSWSPSTGSRILFITTLILLLTIGSYTDEQS